MNALRTTANDGVDIDVPVLAKPLSAPELISMLRSQLDSMDLPRIRRNDRSMAIRRLEAYLGAVPQDPVVVNEQFLNDFEDWLVQGDEASRRYHRKATSHLRSVINAMPENVRRRKLLTNRELNRLDRFSDFSADTRQLLERFLVDGRKIKKTPDGLKATSSLLSPVVRDRAMSAVTMILRLVGLSDILGFDEDHMEKYLRCCGENGRENAVHTLWNARCLFRWLVATGVIGEDPLQGIVQQKTRVDTDYIPADQIAKLADLVTLDLNSFRDVRDRLIAFALCYDCGLRIGEVVRLGVNDVRINDFVELLLRGEIQKGEHKPSCTLRNLFPESRTLFEAYLALRPEVGTDALLLSETGKPLLASGCRSAVKRVSKELGILTHGQRTPRPHRYRHSLGTLHIGELGMKLSPYYLMRRYRHNDIRTTMEVYVANNPLLDEAQHVAIVSAANGNGHAADSDPKRQAMASDITVPETAAMMRVRALGISWRSLRDHALVERAAVERKGKRYYSEAFLDRLCTEWMTKEEAMRLMGISSPTAYHNRVRNHGIETLVIGRASLAKSADVVRSLR